MKLFVSVIVVLYVLGFICFLMNVHQHRPITLEARMVSQAISVCLAIWGAYLLGNN